MSPLKTLKQFGCLLTLALFVFSGCQSKYSGKDLTNTPAPILKSSARVYVAIPFDASFKEQVAQGSGKLTAQAYQAALLRYTRSVYVARTPQSFEEAIGAGRTAKLDFMIYPHIIRWEDRSTEWSGRRDRITLKVDLVDLSTGQVAFSRVIEGTGKWMTDGGESPRDLLDGPAEQYVNSLFRQIEKPSAMW